MMQEHIARLLDDARLTVEEFAASCTVSCGWVVEQARADLPAD